MVGIDKRETFIILTANDFLGIEKKTSSFDPEDHASIDKFLSVATCRILCAKLNHNDDNIVLKFTNDPPSANSDKTLIFFKTKSSSITNSNFHDLVHVTSTIGNPGSVLIETLHEVWAPTLQSSGYSITCLKKLEEDILGPKPSVSLIEEEALWKKKHSEIKKSKDKKIIDTLIRIIQDIRNELESATNSKDGLGAVEEILEVIAGYIDDIWKLETPYYTEERMRILLDIIDNNIAFVVHIVLSEVIRNADTRMKDDAITNAAVICEKWVSICEKLTTLFWPHQSLHPWMGMAFVPLKCSKLHDRLRQTANIRLQHRQMDQLLSGSEKSRLNMWNLLENLEDLSIIFHDDDRDIEWTRMKRKFEEGLKPVEQRVIENLKKQMATINNPILLVEEFRKYSELLKMNNIKQFLRSERETLLSVIDDIIAYQCGPDAENLLNYPQILQEIQAVRLGESKLNILYMLTEQLLNDLSGYESAISKITFAIKEAEVKRHNLVETWTTEIDAMIAEKKLTLKIDSPVVELVGKSMMKVNYDPKLISFIKESRALSGLGIELPREVRELVECAGALAGRARALQQIANFHNTIGDRMIASQRPLMLSTALELARAVQEQSGVIWSDLHAVDAYTNHLKEYVRKFARQNSELVSKHTQLRDLVANLLKSEVVNLVGSQGIWKDSLKKMRTIVDEVETVYGNSKAWKLHWDRQLLKVLGAAYRAALPKLVRKLPEIRIELIYRDNTLIWHPPLEEIRAKLYSGIRRFLAIPLNFRGVGEPIEGNFDVIVEQSAHLFGGVYKEAESALASLETVKFKWLSLTTPVEINSEHLKKFSPQEWEKSFRDAKQWAQEIGKLRGGEKKIYCFTMDTTITRNDLESATRRHWEYLSSNLRAIASSRLVLVLNFLSSATKELDRHPISVEEIGLSYETHKRIEEQSSGMKQELEAVIGLARVMTAWTRELLDGVSEACTSWDGLSEQLSRHKTIVARQLEDAKINLRHRAAALKDERDRWNTRWTSKPDIITVEWLLSMRERWVSLKEQKDLLILNCQRVDMSIDEILVEDLDVLRDLELKLQAEESNCRFQQEFMKELANQVSDEWSIVRRRIPRLHNWLDSWQEKIKVQIYNDTESQNAETKIDTFVGKKIQEFRNEIEWVQLLRGDELVEEHWDELKSILKLEKKVKDITLADLLKVVPEIKLNVEKIKEIIKRAVTESGIRQALIEVESWEASTSLRLHEFKDSKNVIILLMGEYAELLARTGELKLLIEGAKGASGYERFAARAMRCESALCEFEERLKVLGSLQRKWVYLEPVYSSGVAPSDSARWSKADKEFRCLMNEVAKDPRLSSLITLPLAALYHLKDLLDKCQKKLDEFLEEKRSAYPRLYFLCDEDLLELISNSYSCLNTHLPKLFEGVASVKLQEGHLTSIISPEGEVLTFLSSINLSDPLPLWLKHLEEEIRCTLSQSLEKCLVDTNPDLLIYPAQILLLSARIKFTEHCEMALKGGKSSMRNLVKNLETRRAELRSVENKGDNLITQKARNLLLETVHHLDITRSLLKLMDNNEQTSWSWKRHLRCYKTKNGPIFKCADAEFPYRFEYQGTAVGLVRTSLTERCFLALTQAMKLGLGGSPTGPAGTGKTESVKALAAILGRHVIVFNCDEGIDALIMKRILGGLAQAGAWGCFDEFNRLEEKTLSAVAMLVRPLQEAVRDKISHIQIGERNIRLDPHCCIFITMNPSGSDYGGRNKLPDSLARLFRPIGMAHPDSYDIVRALLECAGFIDASTLAHQLIETLDIAEKLLSRQPHYDWGLRVLRSIVIGISQSPVSQNETERVIEAIESTIIAKLTEEDVVKFKRLLRDVFPHTDRLPTEISVTKQELKKVLKEICHSRNLQSDIMIRCEQLFDQLKNRTGVAMVGAPGSGKTLVRKTLLEALIMLGENLKEILIYSGAIPKSLLLGKIDTQTREWKEGLLSAVISSNVNVSLWVVFDGDVEPGWAEALNSVLDDNRILTLPNGVGVKLGTNVKFIFETHELADASPATVSRLGVVHLASTQPSALLSSLISVDHIPPISANIIRNHLPKIIQATSQMTSASIANLIGAILSHLFRVINQNAMTYTLLISLCMQIAETKNRDSIAKLIFQSTDSWCPDPEKPADVIYNAEIDRLEPFGNNHKVIPSDYGPISLSDALKRGLTAISPWILDGRSVIIRGPNGSGRSCLISAILTSLRDSDELFTNVHASSLFGTDDLINRLKRSCVRVESSINGRMYRPRSGSKVILIVEEIHLASKNLQETIRQLVQQGGFYEDDLEFAQMPVTLISTADITTKLHSRLSSSLIAHYLPAPTHTDIITIVNAHLKAVQNVKILMDSKISNLSAAMYESLNEISSSKESLFSWTIKDLCLWSDLLKNYPQPRDEDELIKYVMDVGMHLFYPRISLKNQHRWKSIFISRLSRAEEYSNEIYFWRSGNSTLIPIDNNNWRIEIEDTVGKCTREGEAIEATITPHLLHMISGINWALGCGLRGIMLIGRPGSGRKSATKLVASHSSWRLIDSAPGKARASMKVALQTAGIDGERTILLLEEHHARDDGVAILIRAIVSKGEISGLLGSDELDSLVAPLMDLARNADFNGTLDQYLYHRLRTFLRVVIILDSTDMKKPWLINSGLLNHCLYVADPPGSEWWTSETSLTDFAIRKIPTCFHETNNIRSDLKSGLETLVDSHHRAPFKQQSPARFIALLNKWQELKEKWEHDIDRQLESLQAGTGKLKEAGDRVAKLEDEATRQRKELEEEKQKANAALEQITATMRGATGQRGEMSTLKADTERESVELLRRKADIEEELSKVKPLVEGAAQAVAGIGADALAEVRSLRAPPAAVRDVLEGVLRLMGIRDTSWNSMKIFLAKRGVKDEIRSWDARRSTPASLEAVAKLIKERPDSFEEKTARRASIAAAPLAAWVLANLQYGQILQQVAPLEREQRLLAERLSAAEAQIGKLAAGLNSVESRVSQLQIELAEHSRGAAALQLHSEATEASLATARALLTKLDVEYRDWQSQIESLRLRKIKLGVEAAETASLLIYQDSSKDDKWKQSTLNLLITERERLLWRAQNLPKDTASLVGAVCALHGPLVPLFLDSSDVAVTWLKLNLNNKLETTKPTDTKFFTTLELAVRFGKPLLIEEIVELPTILFPLLRRRPLRLGEKTLAVQHGFKLFLATRSDNLDTIPGEAEAIIFKIKLGVGTKSLAERFIEKALLCDTPEMEKQRREALELEEKLAGERDAARLQLLAQLGAARGQDLLQESSEGEHNSLLTSLEATQTKAIEIACALDKSRQNREEIMKKTKEYEKLAEFAANLFEAMKSLTSLNPLYVFSAEEFTDIYLEAESMRKNLIDVDENQRELFIEGKLISLALHYCMKAVYRKHRLPVALHLALNLNPVPDIERNLLQGDTSLKRATDLKSDSFDWIPQERRRAVQVLISNLPHITSNFQPNWIEDITNIYKETTLTPFQKVLVIQALRPDYMHTALTKLVTEQLGVKDLAPPAWTLNAIAKNNKERHVLFLLSPGADPGPELCALAKCQELAEDFVEVSMGQGQFELAENAIERACRNGGWVLLSNLQLALSWLPRLESILRSSNCTNNKNPLTRIWLTTEECHGFFSGLAGICLKLAYEPPEGVKRNMAKSLGQLQEHKPQSNDSESIFVLAWLHAVLQERRKFVPQGWIRAYEWNEADLEAARELVINHPSKFNPETHLDWEEGRGLLDVAIYGGRLQDQYDMRALDGILKSIWSRDVFHGQNKLASRISVPDINKKDALRLLNQLPDSDEPVEMFGLPLNAIRTWERSAAEKAIVALKDMTIRSLSVMDRRSAKLAELKFQQDLKKFSEQHMDVSKIYSESQNFDNSIDLFFEDERQITKKLIFIVKDDIDNYRVYNSQTPKKWLEDWTTGPREVQAFVNALISKNQYLSSLTYRTCQIINFAKLARPRAFLAALKQHTARESNYPLERLEFHAHWIDKMNDELDEKLEAKTCVILDGLFISGASINNGKLNELSSDAAPILNAPQCKISFVPEDNERNSLNIEMNYGQLEIPVYSDSHRTNLICSLPIKCPKDSLNDWSKRGVLISLLSN